MVDVPEPHDHPVDPARVAAARDAVPDEGTSQAAAARFRLLADPARLRILCALAAGNEMCVGDLALAAGVTENSVSYGLRLLRTAGMVGKRRAGRLVYYRLLDTDVAALLPTAAAAGPPDVSGRPPG